MPTYEYQCEECGAKFERFQSITAAPIRKCPQCGRNKVRRLIGTGGALIFKGSGFYITDYRSDGYKSAASSETAAPKTDGSSKPSESASPKPASPAGDKKKK